MGDQILFSSGLKPELLFMLGIPMPKLLGLVVGHRGGLRRHFKRLDHKRWFGEWEESKSARIVQELIFLLSQALCFIVFYELAVNL